MKRLEQEEEEAETLRQAAQNREVSQRKSPKKMNSPSVVVSRISNKGFGALFQDYSNSKIA